eukprot:g28786.t1
MLFPGGSWYRNHGPPVEWSLPFPSQVDWRGFSIELPYDPAREDLDTWAKRLVPTLLRLQVGEIHQKQEILSKAVPFLRYDFAGTQPDAFTALLNQLAERPLRKPELDCFDPRERFKTDRCLSGAKTLMNEEGSREGDLWHKGMLSEVGKSGHELIPGGVTRLRQPAQALGVAGFLTGQRKVHDLSSDKPCFKPLRRAFKNCSVQTLVSFTGLAPSDPEALVRESFLPPWIAPFRDLRRLRDACYTRVERGTEASVELQELGGSAGNIAVKVLFGAFLLLLGYSWREISELTLRTRKLASARTALLQ